MPAPINAPEAAPTLSRALAAGRPVDAPAGGIAADSLAPRRVGELVFPIARDNVDRVALVSFGDYNWMWYADMALALLAAFVNLPIREAKLKPALAPA